MDTAKLRELLAQHEEIEAQIREAAASFGIGGVAKERRPQRCGTCNEEGHQSRTCTQKKSDIVRLQDRMKAGEV